MFATPPFPHLLPRAFFVKEFAERQICCLSSVSLFDLKARFFVPTRGSLTSSRAGAVKVGRRANLAACSELARPHLDSFEHDGTLGAIGMTIEGSPLSGAVQSRRNLVFGGSKDPNHDAVMRIGSEAPKRRTHSSIRHGSHGDTSGHRHLEPSSATRRKRTDRAETVGCLQRPPFIVPDAGRRPPAPRHPARGATGRSEACAPRPRSWSCGCRGHSRCGLETTAPGRCPSGT